MIELEAKVKLENFEKVYEKVKNSENFSFIWNPVKKDFYFWKSENDFWKIRVRDESWKTFITKKKWIKENWIEKNIENEIETKNFDESIDFVKSLWLFLTDKKIKKSLLYKFWNFTIDFCLIEDLWYFLEIEILTEEKDVDENQWKLLEIFKFFGFLQKDFEEKDYLQLLKENNI